MRLCLLGVLLSGITCLASAQKSIRNVDFKNFNYPLSGPLLGHSDLKWLGDPRDGYAAEKPIHLVNGEDLEKTSSFVMDGRKYSQYEGFKIQSVEFANLDGNGSKDAIVVLRYLTGGTQTTHYVYVYSMENGKPKLLAYCHTGDRAYSGLYKVYGKQRELVFELLDPAKNQGDCCSSGIVRTRYVWRNNHFEQIGKREYEPLKDN